MKPIEGVWMRYGMMFIAFVTCVVQAASNSYAQMEKDPKELSALVELAEMKFGPLPAEHPLRMLIGTVMEGTASVFSNRSHEKLNPDIAPEDWDARTVLKSEHIVWLLTASEAASHVTHRGVVIVGARIEGRLDFSFASLSFPVSFINCSIPNGMNFYQAELRTLVLSGSHLGNEDSSKQSLGGHLVSIQGHLLLARGFVSTGEIDLTGARIGGVLDCGGAKMKRLTVTDSGAQGIVLNAENSTIGGSVLFYDKFESYGLIRLNNARIGGQLLCAEALMKNPKGQVLNADGAAFSNAVLFKKGFVSDGEIRFVGATIRSAFEFDGAKLQGTESGGHGRRALFADSVKIGGSLQFINGFAANGELKLSLADIRGSLELDGAVLKKEVDPIVWTRDRVS